MFVPDPVTHARADAIVAAHEAWSADVEAVRQATGAHAADDRCNALVTAVMDAVDRAAAAPAGSKEALRAKAGLLRLPVMGGEPLLDFMDVAAEGTSPYAPAFFAILRELLASLDA